jgi:hypothetical protein
MSPGLFLRGYGHGLAALVLRPGIGLFALTVATPRLRRDRRRSNHERINRTNSLLNLGRYASFVTKMFRAASPSCRKEASSHLSTRCIICPPVDSLALAHWHALVISLDFGLWSSYFAVCVFYYCRTYYKAVRVGGGGEWRTCAMRDDEPRPVWMSLLITH